MIIRTMEFVYMGPHRTVLMRTEVEFQLIVYGVTEKQNQIT